MGRDLFALNTTGKKEKLNQNKGQGHYTHYINPKLSPDGATLVFQTDIDGYDRYAIWPTNNDRTELKRNNSN